MPSHDQRDRAESFGAVAELYDRHRPGYPDELIDELAGASAGAACWTSAAAPARRRASSPRAGCHVLGVEIDAGMAAVARRGGIEVEVASFETLGRRAAARFDLIVCGQAWHWIDPAVGAPKVVRLLRPGGTVCLFWNYDDPDERLEEIVDAVYRQCGPGAASRCRRPATRTCTSERCTSSGCFASIEVRDYKWSETLPVDGVDARGRHAQQPAAAGTAAADRRCRPRCASAAQRVRRHPATAQRHPRALGAAVTGWRVWSC